MSTTACVRRYFPAGIAACFLGALAGCSKEPQTQAPPPVAVSVYEVVKAEVSPRREFVARTEASSQANLVARLEGTIEEILFEEGSIVEQGQLLVRLEDNTAQATSQQSRADVEAARAELDSAQRNLERGKEVASKGYLSQSDLDQLQDRYNQAVGRLKTAEASLEKSRINLDYTEIRAPFDGRVGKRNVDTGNVVSPASGPIAEILALDPMYVTFQINEVDYLNYQQRRQQAAAQEPPFKLHLKLPNGTEYPEEGQLDFTDVRTDVGTGTVGIRAVFPNPNDVLLPGLFVTLVVESKQAQTQVLVPQMAVQESQEGKFVLLVNAENQVAQRLVKLGQRQGPMWVVTGGLEAGERVIVEGLQKVKTGVSVNPVVKNLDPETGALSDASGG